MTTTSSKPFRFWPLGPDRALPSASTLEKRIRKFSWDSNPRPRIPIPILNHHPLKVLRSLWMVALVDHCTMVVSSHPIAKINHNICHFSVAMTICVKKFEIWRNTHCQETFSDLRWFKNNEDHVANFLSMDLVNWNSRLSSSHPKLTLLIS